MTSSLDSRRGRPLTSLLVAGLLIAATSVESVSFVQKIGDRLYLDGTPWYFLGANAYWIMEFAKSADKRPSIDRFFQTCADFGLNVIRIWGFNHNCPSAKGVYDEWEMNTFDYLISNAGKHKVRLIVALGNTWEAYRSPEDFMQMAGEDPTHKTLLDFYQSAATKEVFKSHMQYMTSRLNIYTGVRYRDDPTIMMWDVLNEPRCPGCQEYWQQQVVQGWLQDMAGTLKGYAPKQLVAAGTEGFFMDEANLRWNPGAGSLCEGEDWVAINQLSALDVSVAHVYDRQMESVPPSWRRPTFDDLLNWLQNYLQAHAAAAQKVGKPLIVEEFNIIFPTFYETQRAQVFQLVYDFLVYQKQVGGPLMGIMFWNAAVGSDLWDDGYNVYFDVLPPPVVASPTPSERSFAPSNQPSGSSGDADRSPIYVNPETLDSFRRGTQRAECAENAAKWWTPKWDEQWAHTVDAAGLLRRTQGKSVPDIIKETVSRLQSAFQV